MKSLIRFINESIEESTGDVEVLMMVGIPGSGKSTWLAKNHPSMPVVSRDIIRAELGYTKSADQKAVLTKKQEEHVTDVENKRIEDFIANGTNFAIDDINTGKFRKGLIDKLHKLGAKVIAVEFNTPLDVCIKRRDGQIPNDVMKKLWDTKEQFKLNPKDVDKIIKVK